MRVLLTTDTVSEVWTYAVELSRALADHDVQIALATMGAPLTAEQLRETQKLPNVQVYESRYKLEWMDNAWQEVYQAGDWLLKLEETERPDLVHLNSYTFGSLPWNVPSLIVGHACMLSWWEAVKRASPPPLWDRYRYEVASGLQGADLVLAPTRTMLAALERLYGRLRATGVVANGCEAHTCDLSAKEPFILALERGWDKEEQIATLEAIAPHLPWPVYVAGSDAPPAEPGQHPSHIHYVGRLSREEVASWMSRASIYVLPTRYEPFGLSALEAGLAGCALVLGDIPSLREVWGNEAMFAPPDDIQALQVTLNALIRSRQLRSRAAARARERASEFSLERMAAGYLEAYRWLTQADRGQTQIDAYPGHLKV